MTSTISLPDHWTSIEIHSKNICVWCVWIGVSKISQSFIIIIFFLQCVLIYIHTHTYTSVWLAREFFFRLSSRSSMFEILKMLFIICFLCVFTNSSSDSNTSNSNNNDDYNDNKSKEDKEHESWVDACVSYFNIKKYEEMN